MKRVDLFKYIGFLLISVMLGLYMYWDSNLHFMLKRPTKADSVSSKTVDFRIIVLTFNRARSLKRLLNSLNLAAFDNDSVVFEIWIDRKKNGSVDKQTLNVANDFSLRNGDVNIHIQEENAGILKQWITTWQPPMQSQEIAVILEDDLTVSPYFYKYLRTVHRNYGHRKDINGFSLQGVSIKHDGSPGFLNISKKNPVFLYPTIGTWGFSPNRMNWFRFVSWYLNVRGSKDFKPLVPHHISSFWYTQLEKENRQESIWEMWHIYFSWKHSLLTLYPNHPEQKGFTFNWQEAGLHYTGGTKRNREEELTGLIQKWNPIYDHLPNTPVLVNNSGVIIN